MLRKQLESFASKLNIAKPNTFAYHLQRLIEADIIKVEPLFINKRETQHHILILKKFALRYLKGETGAGGSQKVSPVPPLRSNERILLATFKSEFILEKLIPSMYKEQLSVSLDDVYREIRKRSSSLLFEKNKGIYYAKQYLEDFEEFLNDELEKQIARMQETIDKRQKGLELGSKAIEGKGKARVTESGVTEGERVGKSVSIHNKKKKKKPLTKQEKVSFEIVFLWKFSVSELHLLS